MAQYSLLSAVALGLIVALAPPASARDCQINGVLSIRGKYLASKLYVSPEEKPFVEGFGLPLASGLLQGSALKLSDVYAWFDANGCNQELVDYVLSKARNKVEKDNNSGGNGGGNGGGNDDGGGNGGGNDGGGGNDNEETPGTDTAY